MVCQVVQDTTVGQHGEFGVQRALLPTEVSVHVVLISLITLLFNLALFITAFVLFQLRTEAEGIFDASQSNPGCGLELGE